jgi:hypothetical protein
LHFIAEALAAFQAEILRALAGRLITGGQALQEISGEQCPFRGDGGEGH